MAYTLAQFTMLCADAAAHTGASIPSGFGFGRIDEMGAESRTIGNRRNAILNARTVAVMLQRMGSMGTGH
jgi:hypothetical protein